MAVLSILSHLNLNKNEVQNAVLQVLGTAPSAPNLGQFYYNSGAADNKVYFYGDIGAGNAWNALAWEADLPVVITDHGALGGLTDDDHTIYALLAGRAGGQTLRGGSAASENLILGSTSNVTKGYIQLEDAVRFTTVPAGAWTDGFIMRNATAGEARLVTPSGTPSASTFLRGDGTWATPAGGFSGFNAGSNNGADQAVNSGDLLDVVGDATYISGTVSKAATTVSVTMTIIDSSITNGKLATMAANTIKGNNTAGVANPSDIALGAYQILARLSGNITAINLLTDTALAAASDSNIATTLAIKTYIDNLLGANDAMRFLGGLDASGVNQLPSGNAGDTYKITVAGNFNGTTEQLEIGDTIVCTTDSTAANTPANWIFLQDNLEAASETVKGFVEEATNAEVAAGTAVGGTGAKLFITPAKLATHLGTAGSNSSIVRRYSALIGDGASLTYSILNATHGLGTTELQVQLSDASTGDIVWTETEITGTAVNIKFNVAPASNSIRVILMG